MFIFFFFHITYLEVVSSLDSGVVACRWFSTADVAAYDLLLPLLLFLSSLQSSMDVFSKLRSYKEKKKYNNGEFNIWTVRIILIRLLLNRYCWIEEKWKSGFELVIKFVATAYLNWMLICLLYRFNRKRNYGTVGHLHPQNFFLDENSSFITILSRFLMSSPPPIFSLKSNYNI